MTNWGLALSSGPLLLCGAVDLICKLGLCFYNRNYIKVSNMYNLKCRNVLSDLYDITRSGQISFKRMIKSIILTFKCFFYIFFYAVITMGWLVCTAACVAVSALMILYDLCLCRKHPSTYRL